MTAVSPQWATWSIQSIKTEPSSSLNKARTTPRPNSSVQTSQSTDKGRLALFAQSSKENILESQWQDFTDDGDEHEEDDLISQARQTTLKNVNEGCGDDKEDIVDVDELFEQVKTFTKEKVDKIDCNDNSIQYRYDPLTPIESQSLFRALKLSKYIPPSAQELEEEKRMISAARIEPGLPPKDDRPADKRRRGNRINEETGKRIYKVGTRATGLNQRENKEAKEVLFAMCKQMLPRRNFDWLIATLTYNQCDLLGFNEEIPSSKMLVREKAMESVKEGKMPMEHLAYVVALLAEASKVDISVYDIVDPTKKARTRGRALAHVRDQMSAQSGAIFDVLRTELFPDLFVPIAPMKGKEIAEKKDSSSGVKLEVKMERRAKETEIDKGEKVEDSGVEERKQVQKNDWQNIFPQLSTQKSPQTNSKDADIKIIKESETYSIFNVISAPSVSLPISEERAEILPSIDVLTKRKSDSDEEISSLKKRRWSSSNLQQVAKQIGRRTDDNSSTIPENPTNLSTTSSAGRLSRRSSNNADGVFKLPLPPFWNKTKN